MTYSNSTSAGLVELTLSSVVEGYGRAVRKFVRIRPHVQRPVTLFHYGRRVAGTLPQLPSGLSTLTPTGQRARYGVSYVRNICAQAGIGLIETSPDEDVLATDCEVEFKEASVRVQVKCTSGLTIGGKTKSYSLKPEWLR